MKSYNRSNRILHGGFSASCNIHPMVLLYNIIILCHHIALHEHTLVHTQNHNNNYVLWHNCKVKQVTEQNALTRMPYSTQRQLTLHKLKVKPYSRKLLLTVNE